VPALSTHKWQDQRTLHVSITYECNVAKRSYFMPPIICWSLTNSEVTDSIGEEKPRLSDSFPVLPASVYKYLSCSSLHNQRLYQSFHSLNRRAPQFHDEGYFHGINVYRCHVALGHHKSAEDAQSSSKILVTPKIIRPTKDGPMLPLENVSAYLLLENMPQKAAPNVSHRRIRCGKGRTNHRARVPLSQTSAPRIRR
jgi:hypothetical protein